MKKNFIVLQKEIENDVKLFETLRDHLWDIDNKEMFETELIRCVRTLGCEYESIYETLSLGEYYTANEVIDVLDNVILEFYHFVHNLFVYIKGNGNFFHLTDNTKFEYDMHVYGDMVRFIFWEKYWTEYEYIVYVPLEDARAEIPL